MASYIFEMAKRFAKKSDQKRSKDAQRIFKLRKALNLSQRGLAEEFYVSPGAVAHWESGEREIPGPVIKLIEIFEERLKQNE